MNIHLSEVLSEIIEPLVDAYEGGDEIISTEDFKARIEITNEGNTGWSKWGWWVKKSTKCGKYVCCDKCEITERSPPKPAGSEIEEQILDHGEENIFDEE